MVTGLPQNQTAHNPNASASLHFRFIPGSRTAQLTYNMDGIINKLVMAFAAGLLLPRLDPAP